MKKLALLSLLTFITLATFAQKKYVTKASLYLANGDLEQAKQNLDLCLGDTTVMSVPKTWLTFGDYYYELFKKDNTSQENGKSTLMIAFDYYKKALALENKGATLNYVKTKVLMLDMGGRFINMAVEGFNNENFEAALQAFEYALDLKSLPFFKGEVDTVIIYNAGLAALNSKNYPKAIEFFKQAQQYGYGEENTYILIKNIYLAQGDSAKAIESLQLGFEKYPEKTSILIELVNYYLLGGKAKEALDYLKLAKEKDPANAIFLFAEGTLLEQLGRVDDAIESYKKALEIQADYFDPAFNLGIIHYNKAGNLLKEADKIPLKEKARYDAKVNEASEEFKIALPYLEKAMELKPEDKNTILSLKEIYRRLNMNEKYEAIKDKAQ